MSEQIPSIRNADHPYYATHGNYYKSGDECYTEWGSWREFFAAFGDSDPDLNLVYRWDWTDNRLSIFFVLQRKAIHMSAEVIVDSTDEPEIRAWLETRWQTIRAMWQPISGTDEAAS